MPATIGKRATAANQPPTPPIELTITISASSGVIHEAPTRAAIVSSACMMPCNPDTCSRGTATSTLNVPAR